MKGCLIVLGVIIAIPFIWVFAEVFTRSEFERPDATAAAASVSPSELKSAYVANEISADERYAASPIRVSGTVSRVALNLTGGAIVDISEGGASVSAHMLDSEKGWVASIQTGASIALLCNEPFYVLGIVSLRHCIAANPPPTSQM